MYVAMVQQNTCKLGCIHLFHPKLGSCIMTLHGVYFRISLKRGQMPGAKIQGGEKKAHIKDMEGGESPAPPPPPPPTTHPPEINPAL